MKNKAAQQLGKLGGIARASKYSKEQLSKWAKMGGRPKKNDYIPIFGKDDK